MKRKYLVSFYGRRSGEIGISYRINTVVEAPEDADEETIRLATYDAGYEHIDINHDFKFEELKELK